MKLSSLIFSLLFPLLMLAQTQDRRKDSDLVIQHRMKLAKTGNTLPKKIKMDKIEILDAAVVELLNNCAELNPSPNHYFLFEEPTTSTWIILFFFKNEETLHRAIHEGVAYQIHEYLLSNLDKIETLKGLKKILFFEKGIVPENTDGLNNLFTKHSNKLLNLLNNQQGQATNICTSCQHDMGKHQLKGEINEELDYPTEGWVTCIEKGCNCFKTWSKN